MKKVNVINIEIQTVDELEEKIKKLIEKYKNEKIIFNIATISQKN